MARWLAASLVAVILAAGCEGSSEQAAPGQPTSSASTAPASGERGPATGGEAPSGPQPEPPEEGTTDRATMERVVREWSAHLNAEDNDALARLFALPALIAQSGVALELRTYEEIAAWFAGLPCSGTVISISYDRPDVALAVFSLGDRPSSACDGPPGTRAAASFYFRDGKLVGWAQVPVPGQEAPGETPPVI